MNRFPFPTVTVIVLGIHLAACSGESQPVKPKATAQQTTHHSHAQKAPAIGSLAFEASCVADAKALFDRALGMLHHMMYVEARDEFETIMAEHPDCAMAYWGAATARFQPLWPTRPSPDDLTRGWELIQQARSAGAVSERESLLMDATQAFFREPDSAAWWTRIQRWAEQLSVAYSRHGDDPDVAALYALSRLALAANAEAVARAALHAEAAEILLSVQRRQPGHPGAVHYTIHANDADGRAHESLEVVRSYSSIAPDVPHALHMPTHVFVRLGEWPEVISWNHRSALAALQYPAGDAISHHYIHAVDYELYALLQRGEDEQARKKLNEALAMGKLQPSFVSAFHLAAMPARYAVERRDWKQAAQIDARQPPDLPWDKAVWAEGISWFARGLGGARSDDLPRAREAESKLASLHDKAVADGEKGFAAYLEVDRLILAGAIAHAEARTAEAIALLERAADLEATVEKHPVTPGAVYPPYEAMGDLLLAVGQPSAALDAYARSEARWPGRYNTRLGAVRAAAAAGQTEQLAGHLASLLQIAGGSARQSLQEARQLAQGPGATVGGHPAMQSAGPLGQE